MSEAPVGHGARMVPLWRRDLDIDLAQSLKREKAYATGLQRLELVQVVERPPPVPPAPRKGISDAEARELETLRALGIGRAKGDSQRDPSSASAAKAPPAARSSRASSARPHSAHDGLRCMLSARRVRPNWGTGTGSPPRDPRRRSRLGAWAASDREVAAPSPYVFMPLESPRDDGSNSDSLQAVQFSVRWEDDQSRQTGAALMRASEAAATAQLAALRSKEEAAEAEAAAKAEAAAQAAAAETAALNAINSADTPGASPSQVLDRAPALGVASSERAADASTPPAAITAEVDAAAATAAVAPRLHPRAAVSLQGTVKGAAGAGEAARAEGASGASQAVEAVAPRAIARVQIDEAAEAGEAVELLAAMKERVHSLQFALQ